MAWREKSANGLKKRTIESQVEAKLGGRLKDFALDDLGEELILRGKACSYHVKQLALHEVMALTSRPIHSNDIEVNHSEYSLMPVI